MSIAQLILGYEKDFFKKKFCDNIQNLEKRIHDEFIEIGKSGQVFDKNSIIDYLSHLDTDRDIEIHNFVLKELKEDILIASYITNEEGIESKALRTSIWTNEKSAWKLYFHQGTPTELNIFK